MNDIIRKMTTSALRRRERLTELLFEGEANAHRFLIEPDGVSFAGYTVTARFLSAGGETNLTGSLVDGKAAVVLTAACYTTPGVFTLHIFVSNASETVCVYACDGAVLPTTGAGAAIGQPVSVPAQSQDLTTWCAGVAANSGLTIHATPAAEPGPNVGWVDITLDQDNAAIIAAAATGKNVLIFNYSGAPIICHQTQMSVSQSYGTSVYFMGQSVDVACIWLFNVQIRETGAQVACIGSVAVADAMPQSGNG